jgi:hypothetical protein
VASEGVGGRRPVAAVDERLRRAGGVGVRPRPGHAGGARRGGQAPPRVHRPPLRAPGVRRPHHAHDDAAGMID